MGEVEAPGDRPMVKILMGDDDGFRETPWAFDLGDGTYQLDNNPFYAYRVSWGDVVTARPNDEGQLEFIGVVRSSGNRTVRLMFLGEEGSRKASVLKGLLALGCGYEEAFEQLVSVNVPPEVILGDVAGYLKRSGIRWEHADPTHEDLYGSENPPA